MKLAVVFVVALACGVALATPRPGHQPGRPPGSDAPRRYYADAGSACVQNQVDPGIECLENEDTPTELCCSGVCELRGATNVCCLPLGEPCDEGKPNDCCSSSCFAGACN